MAEILETLMIVSFGISWPLSIVRSYRSRSTKGKSLLFLSVSFLAYCCGIISKFMATSLSYVIVFYCINICFVGCDIILFFRNSRYDRLREAQAAEKDSLADTKSQQGQEAH